MTAKELLEFQIDDAGYQLDQVLSGFPEAAMDHKAEGLTMTPRESISHLCEAYLALDKTIKGEKHEWGTYQPVDTSTASLLSEMKSLRDSAVAGSLTDDDDKLKEGHAFIVAHDYYHVGQMCLARLAVEPEWNCYSIYRG